MLTRRVLLKHSALLSLAPTMPAFLSRTAMSARSERDGRVLVVVQLDGGNDGINTVVPFGDEEYARHRQELRLPTDRLCKLTDQVGLHPAMRPAADMVEDGRLAIIQGVGYPNPDRSHFRSMAIWQTARPDNREPESMAGWAVPWTARQRHEWAVGGVRRRPRPAACRARAANRDRVVCRSGRPLAGDARRSASRHPVLRQGMTCPRSSIAR